MTLVPSSLSLCPSRRCVSVWSLRALVTNPCVFNNSVTNTNSHRDIREFTFTSRDAPIWKFLADTDSDVKNINLTDSRY